MELLTGMGEVKRKLHEAGLKYREESEILVSYTLLSLNRSAEGLQRLEYHFYDRRLSEITIDYDIKDMATNFKTYFLDLKQRYGDPLEMEEHSASQFGDKVFIYRWKDDRTILEIHHFPAGRDLSEKSHTGTITWDIKDRELQEQGEKSLQGNLKFLEKLRR